MIEKPEIVWIYGLCDPDTLRVRYVGKSNDPKRRFSGHLSERSLKARNEKNAWIRSLLDRGQKPVLIVLQEVTHGCWAEAERAWICLFRMQGCHLTNTSDGGEGILDQYPDAQITPRPALKTGASSGPRKGGLIPSRPGRGAPRRQDDRPRSEDRPRRPRRGEQASPQRKDGTDRPHLPPRKRKSGRKKKSS